MIHKIQERVQQSLEKPNVEEKFLKQQRNAQATVNLVDTYKVPGGGRRAGTKAFFCDSSWELAFVLYCHDKGVAIERCTEIRQYEWNGKTRGYRPDFVVDGRLVEVKGYQTTQSELKARLNPDIEVWGKERMKPVLNYVIKKFGKNFIELYD